MVYVQMVNLFGGHIYLNERQWVKIKGRACIIVDIIIILYYD